jgi:two-component system CheB/CheR fusion protein
MCQRFGGGVLSEDRSFSHLVLVGESAGGVEALSELVSTLPDDFPAPIVAVQHLNPDRESHLRDILTRRSTLPVRTLDEHNSLPLESGVVFVVPADRHVSVTDTEVCLQQDEHGRPKPSIDLVFESAAEVYGDRLVAVVMTGSDGSDGARAVKDGRYPGSRNSGTSWDAAVARAEQRGYCGGSREHRTGCA